MRTKLFAAVLLIFSLTAAAVPAMAARAVEVPDLVAASDLIVVGRVDASARHDQATASQSFSITVDRVLKGPATPMARRLGVRLDLSQRGALGVAGRQYGIFFLRGAARGGVYGAASPFSPVIVASPAPQAGPPTSPNALVNVARELARVLETPAATLIDPVTGVQDLVVADAAFQAQHVYYEAAVALGTIPYEAAGAALRAAAASDAMPGRLWAIRCLLLSIGKSAEREDAVLRHLQAVAPAMLQPGPDIAFSVSMLAPAMEGRLRSAKAAPLLARLLGSSEVTVRRSAASALSDIRSPAASAALAQTALNDPDQDVRYYAVLGLAEASGSGDVPTMDGFKQTEADYLTHWRGWAKANVK